MFIYIYMYLIHIYIYVKYYGVCCYIYIYPCCTWIANIAWGKKTHVPVVSPWENHHEISTQSVVHIETNRDLEFSSLNPLHHSTRWYQTEFHQNLHSFPQKSPPKSPTNHRKIAPKPKKSPNSSENHREPASRQEIKDGGRQAFRAEVWALQQLQDEGWDGMGIDVKQNMRNTWAVLKSHHLSVIPPVIW